MKTLMKTTMSILALKDVSVSLNNLILFCINIFSEKHVFLVNQNVKQNGIQFIKIFGLVHDQFDQFDQLGYDVYFQIPLI